MPVPPAGSKARYLRGALGEYAIYLDSELAIHNASIWCDEVGGVKVDGQLAQNILKSVQPGSLVVVE